ncbi:MAG: glycosyltransferase [Bacteroidota bacterium]|nr:glycosyltransferase [Bacteroidota bacterium]
MTFSVIVPTYNRLERLKIALEGLYYQDYKDFEIIVVNDGSKDGTAEYLAQAVREHGIRVVELSDLGIAAARNRGAEAAMGNILAFLDDDCSVYPTWLRDLETALQRHRASLVFGNVSNALTDSDYSSVHHEMNQFLIKRMNCDPLHPRFVLTSTFACDPKVFKQYGGFDERFYFGSEDRELIGRLLASGERLAFEKDIVVEHRHQFTLRPFLFYYYRLGRGSHLLYNVANKEKLLGLKTNPIWNIITMISAVGKGKGLFRRFRLIILAFIAQFFIWFGFIHARVVGVSDLRRKNNSETQP